MKVTPVCLQAPWTVSIDDTGGPFSGWCRVQAHPDADLTIVHPTGFRQEFWGALSQKDALAVAELIAVAPPCATR
jgi:hypothetical protein